MENPELISYPSNGNTQFASDEFIAYQINAVVNALQKYALYSADELSAFRDHCGVILNLISRHGESVNMFSRNSKIFESLTNNSVPEETILRNKGIYFPTLSVYELQDILNNFVVTLNFLIDVKTGIVTEVILSSCIDEFNVKNFRGLKNILRAKLTTKYPLTRFVSLEMAFDDNGKQDIARFLKNIRTDDVDPKKVLRKVVQDLNLAFMFELSFHYLNDGLIIFKINNKH
uniref:Uncharacterized protein n=1 Tax=Potato yellow vein virus TaxID=103881 RepID=A0A218M2F4_9CLOS|nr:hypothetical protein [Potato yellow vein virus]QKO00710.1 hypothetical protein [Potato yellow vein virus]